jgi:hypothetical protein
MHEFGKTGRIVRLGTGENQPLNLPKPPREVYGVQVDGGDLEWWNFCDMTRRSSFA